MDDFQNMLDTIHDKEIKLHKRHLDLLYNNHNNEQKLLEIEQSYELHKKDIEQQKQRCLALYKKRKEINFILQSNDYTINSNDINYIFKGEKNI